MLATGLMLVGGCQPKEPIATPEELIAAAVDEKIANWRTRRRKECRDAALKDAQRQADSLVLDYAYAQRLLLDRPARPVRPVEPPLLRPSDTLRLEPFLADTL